ncbi:unnamed protein product [Paramecium sonneborni]|uniref:Uncharacterized protein n=1 Tax=Paramecium sonneborni TaxID=65129 RepID=A0A8S1Q714_9CILI|nr:unnamed protein product [Paramecium sonneborni]
MITLKGAAESKSAESAAFLPRKLIAQKSLINLLDNNLAVFSFQITLTPMRQKNCKIQIPYENAVVIRANTNTINSSQLQAFKMNTTSLYKSNLNNQEDSKAIPQLKKIPHLDQVNSSAQAVTAEVNLPAAYVIFLLTSVAIFQNTLCLATSEFCDQTYFFNIVVSSSVAGNILLFCFSWIY